MKLTLTNDFHNTSVNVIVPSLPYTLSERQTRRAMDALCGMGDCTCGSIRGPQYHDSQRLSVEWRQNQRTGAFLLHIEED